MIRQWIGWIRDDAVAVVSVNPTGPEGAISLRTGLAMLTGAAKAWKDATADV